MRPPSNKFAQPGLFESRAAEELSVEMFGRSISSSRARRNGANGLMDAERAMKASSDAHQAENQEIHGRFPAAAKN